jgi:hypothetical protein
VTKKRLKLKHVSIKEYEKKLIELLFNMMSFRFKGFHKRCLIFGFKRLVRSVVHDLFFLVKFHTIPKKLAFFCHKFNDFLKLKYHSNISLEISPKNSKVQVGSQKYVRFFCLSYFNNQIWLNQLMDDPHRDYITKYEKRKKIEGYRVSMASPYFTLDRYFILESVSSLNNPLNHETNFHENIKI